MFIQLLNAMLESDMHTLLLFHYQSQNVAIILNKSVILRIDEFRVLQVLKSLLKSHWVLILDSIFKESISKCKSIESFLFVEEYLVCWIFVIVKMKYLLLNYFIDAIVLLCIWYRGIYWYLTDVLSDVPLLIHNT